MDLAGQDGRTVAFAAAALAVGVGAAASIGWIASEVNPLYALVPVAALAALYVAAHPTWLLWSALFGGLVVTGLTKLYAPQLQLLRWALAPIAIMLVSHTLWQGLGPHSHRRSLAVPGAVRWALGFLGVAVLASVSGDFIPERFAVGLKGYFQVWGLLLAMALFPWPARVIDQLPRLFLAIAFLQLPFVLHQLLVLVPRRVGMGDGIVPIDIVAGTFGASLHGGGANAILNASLLMVISGLLAARQLGVISLSRLGLLGIPLLLPVLVNEAKVSVLYLLAVFLVLYGSDAIRRPLKFLAAVVSGSILAALLMTAYVVNAPSHAGVETFEDLVRYTYEYNVSSRVVNGGLSRFGALEFWAQRQSSDDLKGFLLGHGVGYTRVADSDTDFRELVKSTNEGIPADIDLASNIGNTAVAALLWETGVIGVLCIFGMLAATYRAAARAEQAYAGVPERAAALRAARAAVAIIFITLWHKNVLVLEVAYQTLLMFLIGYVAYWERQSSVAEAADHDKGCTGSGLIVDTTTQGVQR